MLACMHAKSLQSCLTLCDPMDCSPPGSSVLDSPDRNPGVDYHDLPKSGISSAFLMSPALAARIFTTSATCEVYICVCCCCCCCCCQVTSAMSDSVRPHRQQPTSLLCPWDTPDKNTGVGCHFLLQTLRLLLLLLLLPSRVSRVRLCETP